MISGLDILINNAGILSRANFQDVSMQDIEESMEVNLKSAVKLSQESRTVKPGWAEMIHLQSTPCGYWLGWAGDLRIPELSLRIPPSPPQV